MEFTVALESLLWGACTAGNDKTHWLDRSKDSFGPDAFSCLQMRNARRIRFLVKDLTRGMETSVDWVLLSLIVEALEC